MVPVLVLLATSVPRITTASQAKSQAAKCIEAVGFELPSGQPTVIHASSSSQDVQWMVNWSPFNLRIADAGQMLYFARRSGDYKLLDKPRSVPRFSNSEDAKKYLAQLSHAAGVSPDASIQSIGWSHKRTSAGQGASDVQDYYGTVALMSAGTMHPVAQIKCEASDGALKSYSLEPFGRGTARTVGTFKLP